MSLVIDGNSYIYTTGSSNWQRAVGDFDCTNNSFTMNWEEEDVAIQGLIANVYICETNKTVWITSLDGKYFDVSPSLDKDLTLESFDTFHLKEEIMEIIKLVVKRMMGEDWNVMIYTKDLETEMNFPILCLLYKIEVLDNDVCHIILRHLMGAK